MSKSKRVFLTIMGDEDFWGNGDGRGNTRRPEKKKIEMIEEDEEERAYFEKNEVVNISKLRNTSSESSGDESFAKICELKMKMSSSSSDEDKSDLKNYGALSINSLDGYQIHNFLQNRPEAEIRALLEGPFDIMDDSKFFEAYDQVRKSFTIDTCEETNVIHQLRRNGPVTNGPEQHSQTKHAVVVSNFREPDRRLGRYSKYYYHHNVGPEVYSRKVFVGGLPACVTEIEILTFFSRFGRLQVDWPSKHYAFKSDSDPSIIDSSSEHPPYLPPPPPPPTSHLASLSLDKSFGQINPFLTDFSASSTSDRAPTMSMSCGTGIGGGGGVGEKRQKHLGYVFLLFEKERSVRDLVAECFEEEAGLFITLEDCSNLEAVRVQIRPWLLADAEFLMDFNVPINTKLVAFIGGVPRPLKAVELAHFFEQTYGHVICVGIDIDNKFKYPRGSGRVAFSNYETYVNAITDRYIVLDHEDIHKRVEIKPYFFHNQSCEECSGRYHRQNAPFFCPSLECFQYYCEPCWHKMHSHPSRFHHMPVVKGV